MYFSDIITLRAIAHDADTDGYSTDTNTGTNVFANVKSVGRNEFYGAMANGIKVDILFEIHVEDWGNQTQVEYSSKVYDILKSYQKGLGIVELTCTDKAV